MPLHRLLLASLFVTSALAGCGTMVKGSSQKITLLTLGASEAQCVIDNGVRYKLNTGDKATIMRSGNDLELDCYATGGRYKKVTIPSGFNEWSGLNAANGVAPGVAVDHYGKGLYAYPDVITVDFTDMKALGEELPSYHNKDAPNPYDQSIEPYAPNSPRIAEDGAYMKRGIEKRSQNMSNPFGSDSATEPAIPAPTGPVSLTPMPGPIRGTTADELTRSANPSVFPVK